MGIIKYPSTYPGRYSPDYYQPFKFFFQFPTGIITYKKQFNILNFK